MRSGKIFIVAHCVLNVNSKVEGISPYRSMMREIVEILYDRGYGIIQLPCPEILLYGINRWGHAKEQFDTPAFRKHCRMLFEPVLDQMRHYLINGYTIGGILGIDGSPSCGVNMTWSAPPWKGNMNQKTICGILGEGSLIAGSGIFIEEIRSLLVAENIDIEFYGIDEENPEGSYAGFKRVLSQ